MFHQSRTLIGLCVLLAMLCANTDAADILSPPAVGDEAADFELESLSSGEKVSLTKTLKNGPVVLVVLRGYPGYQCPICHRQVGELIKEKDGFKGATVLMVYPGPSDQLKSKAEEFIGKKTLPGNFDIVLDPGLKFTAAYNLRWDAERETSYPSTFVINKDRKITYAVVSVTHGGRPAAKDVVAAVKALK